MACSYEDESNINRSSGHTFPSQSWSEGYCGSLQCNVLEVGELLHSVHSSVQPRVGKKVQPPIAQRVIMKLLANESVETSATPCKAHYGEDTHDPSIGLRSLSHKRGQRSRVTADNIGAVRDLIKLPAAHYSWNCFKGGSWLWKCSNNHQRRFSLPW